MKVAIICDTHFGRRNDCTYTLEYFSKFYNDIFFPTLEKNKIKHIFHLGDLVERRKFINSFTFHTMNEVFLKKIEKDYEMFICKGNHDTYYKNTNKVNFLDNILFNYKNIHVVDETLEIELNNNKFLMCSWITEENQNSILKEISKSDADYLLGHFELNGFSTGVINMTEGMNPVGFDKFKSVFSGHFHIRQNKENIYYVGCPYEMDITDTKSSKGFFILDTQTGEIQVIENPHRLYERFIYDDFGKDTLKDVCRDFSIFNNKIVDITVKNKRDEILYNKFLDKLMESNTITYNIRNEFEISKYIDRNSEDDVLDMSVESALNMVLNNLVSVNKDRLKSYILDVYNKAEANVRNSET